MAKRISSSYAGVPYLKGDTSYSRALKRIVQSTPGARGSPFGSFSALFDIQKLGYRRPLIVSTTDGVGTKLELARLLRKHDTIGIDLVAMSVNDLVTCGARPILFLDYFATGKFDQRITLQALRGIAQGCCQAGCALLGGETAIMPGFYADSRYDLAGFAVGVVEQSRVIDGRSTRAGNVLLGLESSGFHSNGYSLLRKVFTKRELSGKIGKAFLTPTRIYVKPVLQVVRSLRVYAIAHITGSGFQGNLPRVLPRGLGVQINLGSWPVPPLFFEVQRRARYDTEKMFHTFNMGIGMVLIVSPDDAERAQQIFKRHQIKSWKIGSVIKESGVVLK